jgi:hypothetical protein
MSNYFIAPAPGHYGDRASVCSSHRTLDAAKKAATKGWAIYKGDKRKGQEWLRVYEQHFQRCNKEERK